MHLDDPDAINLLSDLSMYLEAASLYGTGGCLMSRFLEGIRYDAASNVIMVNKSSWSMR